LAGFADRDAIGWISQKRAVCMAAGVCRRFLFASATLMLLLPRRARVNPGENE